MAGFSMAQADPSLMGDDEFDGLYGQVSQKNGLCMAASGRSLDLALARMDWALTLMADEEAKKEKKKKEDKKDAKEQKETTRRTTKRSKKKDQTTTARTTRKKPMKTPSRMRCERPKATAEKTAKV